MQPAASTLFVVLVALGCGSEPHDEGTPCTRHMVSRDSSPIGPTDLDLLFVVDGREGMGPTQSALASELPRLLDSLASGVHPVTGRRFTPVPSLRFGVITSDLGAPGCDTGDEAILQRACGAPAWLELDRFGDDADTVGEQVGCGLTAVGAARCDVSQPLEAALEATTPSTAGLTFANGRTGHGDGLNAGFLRPDAQLVVLTLTRGDDCSVRDPELFDPASATYEGPRSRRCVGHPEALHPVERFVEGLLALKADRPHGLIFVPIAGVPLDLVGDPLRPLAEDLEALRTDPRMQTEADPSDPAVTLPSCTSEALGSAEPPRRLIDVAAELDTTEAVGVLGSACGDDLRQAVDRLVTLVAATRGTGCLPRPIARGPDGLIDCSLVEYVEPTSSCGDRPGRADLGLDDEIDMRRCRVHQVAVHPDGEPLDPADAVGWFYDDASAAVRRFCPHTPHRVALTAGADVVPPARLRLVCVHGEEVLPPGVGAPCAEGCAATPETLATFPRGLSCDPVSVTCRPDCSTAADCIEGWICLDVDADGRGFCVNPSCG